MENKPHFIFALPHEPLTNDESPESPRLADVKNLQKVVLQSFKYCQAKKSKNRYIRTKKVEEMKAYQKKLIAIVKRKSDEAITSLMSFSTEMVLAEETLCHQSSKTDDQTLIRLKEKLTTLKQTDIEQVPSSTMRQKLKRVTVECEDELEKMESSEMSKKTDVQIEELINKMQKPFKKLCSYFSLLNKQIKQMKEIQSGDMVLKKSDSQQTQ